MSDDITITGAGVLRAGAVVWTYCPNSLALQRPAGVTRLGERVLAELRARRTEPLYIIPGT